MAEKITVFDLEDGKVDIDTLEDIVNLQAPTTNTRLSGPVKTWFGVKADLISEANEQIAAVTDNANQAIAETTATAEAVLAGLGYMPPVLYASGLEMTLPNQTVTYNGETYAPIADSLPFTTSGTFETSMFRLVSGVSGADLSSDSGAAMVGTQSGRTQAELNLDLVNVKNYGGKADNVANDAGAITAAGSASGANEKSLIFFPDGEYRVSENITIRGTPLFSNSRLNIEPGVNVNFIPYRIKITDYLAIYPTHQEAFKRAVIRLLSSTHTCLDLEGLRLNLEGPTKIRPEDTPFNTNFAEDKLIANGWLLCDGGAGWSSGTDRLDSDSVFDIGRTFGADGNLLLFLKFQNVIFDARNMDRIKCARVAAYYNMEFINCHFRQFTHVGVWSAGQGDDGVLETSNGLTFTNCRWKGKSGTSGPEGTKTAFLNYDTDVVINGGYIEWVKTGVDSHRGGLKIDGCHFSLGDTSGAGNQKAVILRDPRNFSLLNCDLDSTFVELTNIGNFQGDTSNAYRNWRGLVFGNNMWAGGKLAESPSHGLITCITEADNTNVTQLTIDSNELEVLTHGDNAVKMLGIIQSGSGFFNKFQVGGSQMKGFGVSMNYDSNPYQINDWIQLKYINDSVRHAVSLGNYSNTDGAFNSAPTNAGTGFLVTNGFSAQCNGSVADNGAAWRFYRQTNLQAAIYGNGDIKNVNNVFGAISDASLKHDITNASSQWADIKNIRICNYRFNDNPDVRQLGVIAQEVQQVSPGLVSIDDENGLLSVKYSVLTVKAIKALQEAMDRIEQLESKITALSGSES